MLDDGAILVSSDHGGFNNGNAAKTLFSKRNPMD